MQKSIESLLSILRSEPVRVEQVEQTQADAQPDAPVELDASMLKLVGGGTTATSPNGTW
jgi:hypothetical protein